MAVEHLYLTRPAYFIAAAMLLPVLDIIAVALRFWARKKQSERLRIDDWLLVPATILILATGIMTTYGVSQKAVAHRTEIPSDFVGDLFTLETAQQSLSSKIQFSFDMLLSLALGCVKASVLCFYWRIFVVNRKSSAAYILGGLIVLAILWTLSVLIASIFTCGLNFWAIWGSTKDVITYCSHTLELGLAGCITGAITDAVIILAPLPLIWQLHMSTAKKISIAGVLLLGAICLVASLLRVAMMARLADGDMGPDGDWIIATTEYFYWGMVECTVGIMAACLPLSRVLLNGRSWLSLPSKARSLFSSKQSMPEPTNSRHDAGSVSAQNYPTSLSKQGSEPETLSLGTTSSAKATEAYHMEQMPVHDRV